MSDNTKIEWTDATVNAVNGCSVVSPGCTNCYAMRLAGTRMKHHPSRAGLTTDTKAGPVWNGEVRLSETALMQPLAWKRSRRIFWNAHGDLFHESVPDEWIDRVFAVCALTPQHSHQILTKRSARMRAYLNDPTLACRLFGMSARIAMGKGSGVRWSETAHRLASLWPLPNVWLGVSVEDQARADVRIPDLLATPAAVRFLSCEPLLSSIDLGCIEPRNWSPPQGFVGVNMIDAAKGEGWVFDEDGELDKLLTIPKIDWVIVGGESGPGARPMHPAWAGSIRDQCAAAGVPFHFKQNGEWEPNCGDATHYVEIDGSVREISKTGHGLRPPYTEEPMKRVGKRAAGRLLDGVTHDGMPA